MIESRRVQAASWITLLALLAACAPLKLVPPPEAPREAKLVLARTTFAKLPGWRADNHSQALPALLGSCARVIERPPDQRLGNIGGVTSEWRPLCAAASRVRPGDDSGARYFFESWFAPYQATSDGNPDGLFTGYYEIELRGARARGGSYRVPIYALPKDLITVELGRFDARLQGRRLSGRVAGDKLVPYETRAQIEKGGLAGRAPVLLWVDDPVKAFFLHVQGSGRVIMEDGQVVRLGFAGRNGHAYVSIGRELIRGGIIAREDMSMQAITGWLRAHPGEGAALMSRNPSYIFFRVIEGESPVGAQGVVLTPGRSLAVDPDWVPLGLPVWLDTVDPLSPARPLRRLVVAQDTGAAIKGPVRGDLFWGSGRDAAERAGRMRKSGSYYLLLPRSSAP